MQIFWCVIGVIYSTFFFETVYILPNYVPILTLKVGYYDPDDGKQLVPFLFISYFITATKCS